MNRDLILVAIALFAWGMGESAYLFFQPLYLEELGASPLMIGSILGAVGIVMTITHIPAGYLSDHIGRRIMMWAAWLLGIASGVTMAAAKSLTVFTIGLLLYGATIFVIAPLNSYITAARGKWTVGRAISVTSSAYNTGAILGPIVGGFIGEKFGFSKIYLYATGVFVISTIFILFIRAQPREEQIRGMINLKFLNRKFNTFLLILFIAIFGMYVSQPLAPNFLQNIHNLSLNQIGILGSVSSLGTVVLSLTAGSINSWWGFTLGQVTAGLFPTLLWMGKGFPWFAAGYFMLGGFKTARSMAMAQISGMISLSQLGVAYGVSETISGLAIIIAPPLAGLLYEKNPGYIFQLSILLVAISILLSFKFIKNIKN